MGLRGCGGRGEWRNVVYMLYPAASPQHLAPYSVDFGNEINVDALKQQ